MRPATLTFRVQLPLEWNSYLLSSTDIVNFVWKTDEGEAESIVLLICFFGGAWIVDRWGVVGRSRKSYLGAAEIAFFSGLGFSQSNKHDTLWHVVTGYFCVLFLWTIAISDFWLLEIYKNLGFLLSTITFTVNSHADNHFFKYIYLFQILYSLKSVLLLKYA